MTLSEIKKDCQKKLKRAAQNTYQDGKQIIDESFPKFYSQGNPRRPRTYTLPGAAYTPEPMISDNSAYIEVGYEGDQVSYSDGTFTGGEVLGATMTGTYGVVGNPSYDNEAFEEIGEAVDKNFGTEFG